jgi:hypothetical protein
MDPTPPAIERHPYLGVRQPSDLPHRRHSEQIESSGDLCAVDAVNFFDPQSYAHQGLSE